MCPSMVKSAEQHRQKPTFRALAATARDDWSSMEVLGDLHNYGRATRALPEDRILKPRCVTWEAAFLAPGGALRRAAYAAWARRASPFLDVLPVSTFQVHGPLEAYVDKCLVAPLAPRPL